MVDFKPTTAAGPVLRGGRYSVQASSLDPLETDSHLPAGVMLDDYDAPRDEFRVEPILLPEAVFRHSGWSPIRHKIWESFKSLGVSSARLDRFANCGSAALVVMDPKTDRHRITSTHCHDRFCMPCAAARSLHIRQNLEAHCKGKTVRFATLTLRHSQTPLKEQMKRLTRSFADLRRRKFWQEHVVGGAWVMEIKLSDRDGLWHVHLHMLVETDWLDSKVLSTEWHNVTGDSYIVDVRPIRDHDKGIAYVSKYAAKPLDSGIYHCEKELAEAILALRGVKAVATFGTWRGLKLEAESHDDTQWIIVGRLTSILRAAANGDDAAALILAKLRSDSASFRANQELANSS